jgi:hypothetical protein
MSHPVLQVISIGAVLTYPGSQCEFVARPDSPLFLGRPLGKSSKAGVLECGSEHCLLRGALGGISHTIIGVSPPARGWHFLLDLITARKPQCSVPAIREKVVESHGLDGS